MIYVALCLFVFFNIILRITPDIKNSNYVKSPLLRCLFIFPPYKITYKGLITYLVHFGLLIIVCLFYITEWFYIQDMPTILATIYIIISFGTCWWAHVFDRYS